MSVFNSIPAPKMRWSRFNLSYIKKFTANFGFLYPVMCDEVVPGDKFKITAQHVVRCQPMNAPVMADIQIRTEYFFVPYRLLWNKDRNAESQYTNNVLVNSGDWETFITGGQPDANMHLDDSILPRYLTPASGATVTAKSTLWDLFGFPTGITWTAPNSKNGLMQDSTNSSFYNMPLAFPWFAVNFVWNELYRDENLQSKRSSYDNSLPLRNWKKDYFTSALPWQQKGTAPALPIYGSAPIGWSTDNGQTIAGSFGAWNYGDFNTATAKIGSGTYSDIHTTTLGDDNSKAGFQYQNPNSVTSSSKAYAFADLGSVTSADISELRLSFQVQRWLETNSFAGSRYTEFLRGHFGLAPRDEVLQRPVYIGGTKSSLLTSQVLQTSVGNSDNDTPTGMMRGQGINADATKVGTYLVKEFGLILGLFSILPKADYQQGINRQWLRRTRYDFYFPEFAHLSMQGIEEGELYWTHAGDLDSKTGDFEIFGYQGFHDEMRHKPNMVCNSMRDTFDYWHLARKFNAKPTLSNTFITVNPTNDDLMRIFAVQDEDPFIVEFANIVTASRPIPAVGIPSTL